MITKASNQTIPCIVAAFLIACCYVFLMSNFIVTDISGGADQNAYIQAGRNFVCSGVVRKEIADDFEYFGEMWIRAKENIIYPKYPPGYYLIIAGSEIIKHGSYSFLGIIFAVVSACGIFCVSRFFLSPQYSLMVYGIFLLSPIISLAALKNTSDLPALCLFIWGMFFFLFSIRKKKYDFIYVFLSSSFFAYSVYIRYPAIILLSIPIILGIYIKKYRNTILFLFVFGVAMIPLLIYHKCLWGNYCGSGYSLAGETTAFSIRYFVVHFIPYIVNFFRDALGPVGGCAFFALVFHRRLKLFLWITWIAPSLLFYPFYYFAIDNNDFSYLRFLMPIIPAFYIMSIISISKITGHKQNKYILIMLLAFTHICFSFFLFYSQAQELKIKNNNMKEIIYFASNTIPLGATIIAQYDLLEELDFAKKWKLWSDVCLDKHEIENYLNIIDHNNVIWMKNSQLGLFFLKHKALSNIEWHNLISNKLVDEIKIQDVYILANKDFSDTIKKKLSNKLCIKVVGIKVIDTVTYEISTINLLNYNVKSL